MQAGKLRHRVTIQQLVAGSPQRTATGQHDTTWTDVTTVWAAVGPLSGRRLEAANATWSAVRVEILIRYRAGVTAGMRVVYGGRYYLIEAIIDPQERHRELRLMCAEGAVN